MAHHLRNASESLERTMSSKRIDDYLRQVLSSRTSQKDGMQVLYQNLGINSPQSMHSRGQSCGGGSRIIIKENEVQHYKLDTLGCENSKRSRTLGNVMVDTGNFKSTTDKLQTLKDTLNNIKGHISEYKHSIQSPEFQEVNLHFNFEEIREMAPSCEQTERILPQRRISTITDDKIQPEYIDIITSPKPLPTQPEPTSPASPMSFNQNLDRHQSKRNNLEYKKIKATFNKLLLKKEVLIASLYKEIQLSQEDVDFFKQRNLCLQNQYKRAQAKAKNQEQEWDKDQKVSQQSLYNFKLEFKRAKEIWENQKEQMIENKNTLEDENARIQQKVDQFQQQIKMLRQRQQRSRSRPSSQLQNMADGNHQRANTVLGQVRNIQQSPFGSTNFRKSGNLEIWREIRRGNSMSHMSHNSVPNTGLSVYENDLKNVITQEFISNFNLTDGDNKEIHEIFRKINKQKKFCQKVLNMVKEVEGKSFSIAECWKWQKGLLLDFIKLKEENQRVNNLLEQQGALIQDMKQSQNAKAEGAICFDPSVNYKFNFASKQPTATNSFHDTRVLYSSNQVTGRPEVLTSPTGGPFSATTEPQAKRYKQELGPKMATTDNFCQYQMLNQSSSAHINALDQPPPRLVSSQSLEESSAELKARGSLQTYMQESRKLSINQLLSNGFTSPEYELHQPADLKEQPLGLADFHRLNEKLETREDMALESTGKSSLPPAIAEDLNQLAQQPLPQQPEPTRHLARAKGSSPNPTRNLQTIYTFNHSVRHQNESRSRDQEFSLNSQTCQQYLN